MRYSEKYSNWEIYVLFNNFSDAKLFLKEVDSRIPDDVLTGMNFWKVDLSKALDEPIKSLGITIAKDKTPLEKIQEINIATKTIMNLQKDVKLKIDAFHFLSRTIPSENLSSLSFFIVALFFEKKCDFDEVKKLIEIFKGKEFDVDSDDAIIYFSALSKFNALGNAYELLKNLETFKN